MVFKCYKISLKLWIAFYLGYLAAYSYADNKLTDEEVAAILIQESIRNYSGNCPCPYNVMKSGRRCGGYSAYSKPGGKSPLCYQEDVTAEMINAWRAEH